MNFRRMIAGLVAGIVALVASLSVVSPAQAASSDCYNYPGTICLFAAPNWGLPIWRQYPSQIQGCRNLTGFDNVATVIANNTTAGYTLAVFQYPGCSGATFSVGSNLYYNLSGDWWNDKASSVMIIAS
jgi:hypothetical protein